MYFKFLLLLTVNLVFTAFSSAEIYKSEKHSFEVTTLFSGLDHPWGVGFLSEQELLITERSGQLLMANLKSGEISKVQGLPAIHEYGQGGLLDVLVHPNYTENQWIYLSYAKAEGRRYGTEVLRAELQDKTLSNIKTIFTAQPKVTGTRHFGSRLVIDQQGYLFISLGDRGDRPLAQALDSHVGSLIRLHDDGSVPQDNPFVGQENKLPEIFSYGHRNAQGMTLRNSDQSLWLHEHGPQGGDELNQPGIGKNYGWPVITYGVNYGLGTKIGEGTDRKGMEQPIYYWVPSIAPSGMAFYDADQFPNWEGNLFIGSLKFSQLVRLEFKGSEVIHEERLLTDEYGRIRDVRQGPDGLVYLLTDSGNGKLLRLNPAE